MENKEDKSVIPWDTNTTQQWLDEVEEWEWEKVESEQLWRKKGLCPNCNHPMNKDLFRIYALIDVAKIGIGIKCNCNENHPGRPDGEYGGCGFAGTGFSPPKEEF